MLEYLSADNICSEKRTVFRERSSRKTGSFEEQIMFKVKYPSNGDGDYCVYYPSNIFRNTRRFENWEIFVHYNCRDIEKTFDLTRTFDIF